MPSTLLRVDLRRVARRAGAAGLLLGVVFHTAASISPTAQGSGATPGAAVFAPPRDAALTPATVALARRTQADRTWSPSGAVPRRRAPRDNPPVRAASTVSALARDGIPVVALDAYRTAAQVADREDPQCHLSWTLLAGIGRVESDHGRFAGAELLADGTSSFKIIGIPLDGNGTEVVTDTDGGRLDGDPVFDRAVGPMQFIPSTWTAYGVDADGDGVANPFDIDDAALGAAHYLCASGADLSTAAGQIAAVLTYNHSDAYVAAVRALAAAYASGVATVPAVLADGAAPAVAPAAPTAPAPRPPATSTTSGAPTREPTTSVPTSSVSDSVSTSAQPTPTMTNRSSTPVTSTTAATSTTTSRCPQPSATASLPATGSVSVTQSASELTTSSSTSAVASATADGSTTSTGSTTLSTSASQTAASCLPAAGAPRAAAPVASAAAGGTVLVLLVLIGACVRRRTAPAAHM